MFRIGKLALAGLTAVSLTLTPMTASAGPDGEDIAKVIAGLAVIGLIAKAADDRNDRRRERAAKAVRDPFATIERNPSQRVIEGTISRPRSQQTYQGVRRVALPDRCVRVLTTSRGDRTIYGARCLNQNYIYANQLPNACRLQVRTNNGVRNAYGARCLRRDGWQVARF